MDDNYDSSNYGSSNGYDSRITIIKQQESGWNVFLIIAVTLFILFFVFWLFLGSAIKIKIKKGIKQSPLPITP